MIGPKTRRYAAGGAVLLAVSAVVLLVGGARAPFGRASATGPGKISHAALEAIARDIAARNGEANPMSSEAVETTRAEADALVTPGAVSDIHDGSRDVFLITVHGHFVGHLAHVPPGHALPSGSILTITVDAESGLISDWGLSDERPAMERAGTVTSLG